MLVSHRIACALGWHQPARVRFTVALLLVAAAACTDRTGPPPRTRPPGSCIQGDALGCFETAKSFAYKGQPEASVRYFARACELGHHKSCLRAGAAYARGEHVRKDEATAAKLFLRGCDVSGEACSLAAYYVNEEQEQIRLAEKGCDAGVTSGCALLGLLLKRGSEPQPAQAFQALKRACSANDDRVNAANACQELGHMYERGVSVRQSDSTAVSLYERACGLHSRYCILLADAYWKGTGVAQSRERAVQLYERGCKAGNPVACRAQQSLARGEPFDGVSSSRKE